MLLWMLFLGFLLPIVAYGLFLLRLSKGWLSYPTIEESTNSSVKVSVVVCARNESEYIQHLLASLIAQCYVNKEIIVVDDGSTDSTAEIALSFSEVELLSLPEGVGKKKALRKGIEQATGDLIICTDADCTMGPEWIEALVQCYDRQRPDMIIGPVRMSCNKTLFQIMQAVEFMSLAASTAGSAVIGHPIMCNGANLSFTKTTWNDSSTELVEEFVSGDDVFLMESIKERGGKIVYVKSQRAMVTTAPIETVRAFFHQRSRWVSKSSAYTDPEIKFVSILVVLTTIIPLLLLVVGFFNSHFFLIALIFWLIKSFMDMVFLHLFHSFFAIPLSLFVFLLLAIIYPFYLVVALVMGKTRKVVWK
jgi:cellulose synthase/poly-beta-1,6-N-acetylglucosamine synthase-like glycosyltransferase